MTRRAAKATATTAAELEDALEGVSGKVGGFAPGSAPTVNLEDAIKEQRLRAMDIDVSQMEGEVVPVAAVQEALANTAGEITNRLHTMGNSLAPRLARATDPAVCRKIVDDRIDEILKGMNDLNIRGIAVAAAEQTRLQKHRKRVASK